MASQTELTEFLAQQRDTADQIEKLVQNVSKTALVQRTSEQRAAKEEILQKLWSEFQECHQKLEKGLLSDHPYLKEELFKATEATVNLGFEKLNTWKSLQPQVPPSTANPSNLPENKPFVPTLPIPPNGPAAQVPDPTEVHHFNHHGYGTLPNPDPWVLQGSRNYVAASAPKLAPITIPPFNGEWKKWTTFIGLFESLIDANPYLVPVQKLQYLLNYLQGEARESIAHIVLCNENYSIAMDILRRRYDNQRKICQDYVEKILDLPKMESRNAAGLLRISNVLTLSLHGLDHCNYNTKSWAPIVVACVTRKLDEESRQKFEESLADSRKVPSIDTLTDFLDRRYQVLLSEPSDRHLFSVKKKSFAALTTNPTTNEQRKRSCVMCHSSDHHIRQCERFLNLSTPQRIQCAKSKKLCLNCLGDHTWKCNSRFTCGTCKGQHHTLLHLERTYSSPQQTSTHSHLANKGNNVLLATALVRVRNFFGQTETLRALIDPGSQDSFITSTAASSLSLPQFRTNVKVSGIGGANAGKIASQVNLHLGAHYPTMQQFQVSALVLPKLTAYLPEEPIDISSLPELPKNIAMADPTFNEPGPIDLLLGAGFFAEIVKEGTRKFNNNQLLLQNTELGWILTGRLLETIRQSQSLISLSELDEKMKAFWEMEEEPPTTNSRNKLDELFETTTTREDTGRYIVQLPKKEDVYGQLGASRNMAVARLINLEKSFSKNPHMASEYHKFLKEYEDLGHMTKVAAFAGPESGAYYLPHHAVTKESSTTTKVRVVFNGSAKTSTGLSLNSLLDPGHKQQQDLHQIILRWRKHRIVVNADIEKMFRQIIVAPADRDLQRIVWRHNPTDPISDYQLNTVTYGTAPATYLAVRTLLQLAQDEGAEYPVGKEVLLRDFYMDDLLSGADDKKGALLIQQQISELLAKGGMCIRKWTSNSRELAEQIPEELLESGDWLLNPDATIKTLGIVWNPQRDELRIMINLDDLLQQKMTKRTLLSNIATIFDPLGFLAPISFTCKTWMQQLWKEETDWDQQVSEDIERKWTTLRKELHLIPEMTIPRWIQFTKESRVQIHGFCDASEKGYAAVIYSRIVDQHGQVHINLLTSKSKVAPLKNQLTLPRMELAGALLLAQLTSDAVQTLDIDNPELFFWCDSQISLAWINKAPSTWTTFVANRVASIQQLSSSNQWRYVNTKENPADVASRGCSPLALLNHHLWWTGPAWLKQSAETWPSAVKCCTEEETRRTHCHLAAKQTQPNELLDRYSSFQRLVRISAWIMRLKGQTTKGGLQAKELILSRHRILRVLQQQEFSEEIAALQKNLPLPSKSRLLVLAPYLDESGLLRVGGRLRHSLLASDAKHPILLPRNHHLTKSIIMETHLKTLHGGAQLVLSNLRNSYWIINGRSNVQQVLRCCVKCRRFASSPPTQKMGDLPASRLTIAPAFARTGVDFCGPFLYRCSKGRGIKTTKGYVAVFVCFITKAIHLELVSDLTSDAFIASLKRFIARRGLPKEIHSDNGTNFQGASRVLKKEFQEVIQNSTTNAAELLANDGISWSFIPPNSPHLGGLWEAGVKSVKKHMKRVLDETKLTYEEFSTVLCQIEACVNSRPLYSTSSDPNDLAVLTPGHFLITRALVGPPEPVTLDANPAKRWKMLTQIYQHFWQRWSSEYLTQLQQRSKWQKEQRNPAVGEMVLLKERGLPPTKWPLGRIIELHPGDDQRVRLVTIRTKGSAQVKQPLVNLCFLKPGEEQHTTKEDDPEQQTRVSLVSINHQNVSRPLLKKRTSTNGFIYMLMMLMMTTLLPTCHSTTIVQTKPGLYIERMGVCQLKRGTLRLQTQISFAEMSNDEQHLNDLSKNISNIFTQWIGRHDGDPSERIPYSLMFSRFEKRRAQITELIAELRTVKTRTRRGIFGKLLTSIFGVNDEVYAQVEMLQKGQLTNNQNNLRISSMLERAHQDLLSHQKQLALSFSHSQDIINHLSLETHRHTIMHHLMATYTNSMAFLEEVYQKYGALEKAVLGQSSIMDLLPLNQINAAIRNATDRLPHGFFVLHIPDAFVDTNVTSEHLTISGFFPIASSQQFDLLHLTPIPEPRNDSYIMNKLPARTVALNYNDQHYFELHENQLKSCQHLSSDHYLCDTPVLSTMNFSRCSWLSTLYNRTETTDCETTSLDIQGVLWQKLMMANTWLFTTNSSTIVAVICKSTRQDLQLSGSGIVKLEPGCVIKTDAYTISSVFSLDMSIKETFVKEASFPMETIFNDQRVELLNPPPFTNPMDLVTDMLPLPSMPGNHHNLILILPWILIVLGSACWFFFHRIIKMKKNCKASVPARRHSAPSLIERFDSAMSVLAPQHV